MVLKSLNDDKSTYFIPIDNENLILADYYVRFVELNIKKSNKAQARDKPVLELFFSVINFS